MREKVDHIYNALFKFEKGKKNKLYPIHKKLQFKNSATYKNYTDVSDWIIEHISLAKTATILDAGCGVGYVLLKLCKAYGCNGIGISLSPHEIQAAQTNAIQQQLQNTCNFRVQNFDDLESETFDLIIAIESIKHAQNVEDTLLVFQQHLKPNGQLIVVEDFLNPAYKQHALTNAFSDAWNVPNVYTEYEFEQYAKQAQLTVVKSIALSNLIIKKNTFVTRLKLWIVQVCRQFVKNRNKQTQLNIYMGALIMDYFYANNIFKYQLKVYRTK